MINGSAWKLIKVYSLQTSLHNTFPYPKNLVRRGGGEWTESFPREIFPPLPRTRIQRRRLREWSIYDQEINQIGFINSQLALIASDTVFSVSMQPWKHLTLICCWHEMSFTSRDSSERGDYLGSVVYAMLPRARPLWPHRRTMNSILKTLGNRKHQIPIHHYRFSLQIRKKTKSLRLRSPSHSISEVFCVCSIENKSLFYYCLFYITQLCSKGHAGFLLCWVHESAANGDELGRGRKNCFITFCGRRLSLFTKV